MVKRVARVEVNLGTVLLMPRPIDLKGTDLNVTCMGYWYEGGKNEGDFRKDITSLLSAEEKQKLADIIDGLMNKVEELGL